MRHCLIICAALLAACGRDPVQTALVTAPVDPGLLQPCSGWTGPTPQTEGELADAMLAEKRGRLTCNAQIEAVAKILDLASQ